jgi:hypothetical protein
MQKANRKAILSLVLIATCVLSFFAGRYIQRSSTEAEQTKKYQDYQFNQIWAVCDALESAASNNDRSAVRVAAFRLQELDVFRRNDLNTMGGNAGPGVWAELSDVLLWGAELAQVTLRPCYSGEGMTPEEIDVLSQLNGIFNTFLDRLSKDNATSGKREIEYMSRFALQSESKTHEQAVRDLLEYAQ